MLRQRPFRLLFATTAVLCLFPLIAFTSVKIMEDSGEKRPDILTIDIPSSPDHKDMPAVKFKHDMHTQAVEGQCAKCHEKKEEATLFKFKRTEEIPGRNLMDLYHDNCIACHEETKKTAQATGPMEAECRACHNADFNLESSWKKINFDRSLHFRHESAKEIPSTVQSEETNCNACHHSYNEKTKAIFYQKGEEGACVYCHKETAEDGIRSGRNAAHDSCVACHLKLTEKKIQTGPVDCQGCHEQAAQEKIKVAKEIPRLQRNQPDAALLTGWTILGSDPAENKKTVAQYMDPVAFDHKSHEEKVQTCKACHHETLKKCDSCHTDKGDEKGGYIKLAQAMHSADKPQSCLGCHNELKKAKDCAGCHSQMPDKAFKENACASCHNVDAKETPMELLTDKKAAGNLAQTVRQNQTPPYAKVDLDNIPETISIKTIADEYKPSQFPHRMVVQAIFERAGQSSMAKAFHGNELTLCMGCHHNSPATLTPPKCASCHGETPDLDSGKPGLKGAYHGQCITCHQKMEVKSVVPTDCIKCHELKAS
ncbi:MAG: cytochrome c family protein [Proteobacteria bacterium]|nr:cytochrome c family protein [Pseudomonadota bacterium]